MRTALAAHFNGADLDKMEAAGIDLSKIWALIQALGPKVVPLILLWLSTQPQTQWVTAIEALLQALFTPVPTP